VIVQNCSGGRSVKKVGIVRIAKIGYFFAALAGLCALIGGAGTGSGADLGAGMPTKAPPVAPALTSAWSYRLTPYAWITGLNGSQTVRGRTVDVDASFIDIVENSDSIFALMGYFEARNGRFALFGDLVYSKITASGDASRSRTSRHVTGAIGAALDIDYEMATLTFGAAYELARWGAGGPASFTAIDIIGGGRYWWQNVDINLGVVGTVNLAGLTLSRSGLRAASGSVDWIDPFVGVRVRHQIAPGKELTFSGDVGGFGAGSKFSWQLVGAYSWEFCVTQHVAWSAVIGYRALYVDYEQGSGLTRYEYDMLQHGPILGVSLRF
jgi:hypothetical protein